MSLNDFLFNGAPPSSITTYGSTSTALPPWFEAYQQGLLGKANQVAGEPYSDRVFNAPDKSAYDALSQARIAPFNGYTNYGNTLGQTASESYVPALNSGLSATTSALNGMTGYGAASPSLGAATGAFGTAGGMLGTAGNTYGTAGNTFGDAGGYLSQAGGMPTGTAAGSPGINASTAGWPTAVNQYMNPFIDQVGNRITSLSNRNLLENVIPGINDNFVKTGMFGANRQQEFTNRAVRDNADSLNGTLAGTYANAYNTGANQYQTDAARRLQAGQTLGTLAGSDMANRTNLGQATTALGSAQTNLGSQQGNLGGLQTSLGNAYGNLGNISGTLANQDRSTTGVLGQDMSALAQQQQRLGLTGASIYQGIGQQQQAQQQNLLDLMYQNFTDQRDYPQNQVNFMDQVIRGLPAPTSQATTSTGPTNNYNAPGFAQILGAATGLSGLLGKKRGGRIGALA